MSGRKSRGKAPGRGGLSGEGLHHKGLRGRRPDGNVSGQGASNAASSGSFVIRAADDAARPEAIRIFLRSFREDSTSAETWLNHFTGMLEAAGLIHLMVAGKLGSAEKSGAVAGQRHAEKPGRAGRPSRRGERVRIAGCGALICFVETAWIALMGVEPGLQGKGIGNLLMTALMDRARELEYKTLKLDATNFGKGLYAKHGFVEEYPAAMYEIPASCDSADRRAPKVRLDDRLPAWCAELDREATGDDRSTLLWAALADGGKLLTVEGEGFGMLHGRKVGPIIARNPEVAIAVMRRADAFGANRIYVPLHPLLPREFLAGLKKIPPRWELECCTRMIYGERVKENISLVYAGYSAATG